MPVKAGYLFLAGGGAVVIWSGVKGKRVTDVFRSLVGGDSPANLPSPYNVAGVTPGTLATNPGTTPGSTPNPANNNPPGINFRNTAGIPQGGNPAQNQALAKLLAVAMGHPDWTVGQQWSDWVALWNGESSWDQTAYNPGRHTTNPDDTHAFGIPQALPASKMASAGADWRTSAKTQIIWGIGYIAGVYGSPSDAYAKWLARDPHWY